MGYGRYFSFHKTVGHLGESLQAFAIISLTFGYLLFI